MAATGLPAGLFRPMIETPIRVHGMEMLYIGDADRQNGALATREAFEAFEDSYAHLMASGVIMRYGVAIGARDDIEWLREEN